MICTPVNKFKKQQNKNSYYGESSQVTFIMWYRKVAERIICILSERYCDLGDIGGKLKRTDADLRERDYFSVMCFVIYKEKFWYETFF